MNKTSLQGNGTGRLLIDQSKLGWSELTLNYYNLSTIFHCRHVFFLTCASFSFNCFDYFESDSLITTLLEGFVEESN